ncbi:class I SAM-dependent methyltransferase [Ilumatobacter sp.]|uniref:class I SAM-dependent methyltransferase n=1 Tax=Ilumatobacter sp. TaxID=1967498 RepID=UPI003C618EFC
MLERSQWAKITDADPEHSTRYIERFRAMAEAGNDLHGEARFIDAMASRRSRILDAGCGPGRVGGALAIAGHDVVGVDVDPVLIAAAERDEPGPTWLVGDLAELDLPGRGIADRFDLIVCAGNVMTFLAPSTRRDVLTGFRNHLADEGRAAIGFGSGRGYEFDDFFDDARAAGLDVDVKLATWDLRPFGEDSDFLVAVVRPTPS